MLWHFHSAISFRFAFLFNWDCNLPQISFRTHKEQLLHKLLLNYGVFWDQCLTDFITHTEALLVFPKRPLCFARMPALGRLFPSHSCIQALTDLFSFYFLRLHRSQNIQCQRAWVRWVFYTVPFDQRCKSPAWNNNQLQQAFKDTVLHLIYAERCWHYLQISVEHIRNVNVLNEPKQNNSEKLALFGSFLLQYLYIPFPAAQNTNIYSVLPYFHTCKFLLKWLTWAWYNMQVVCVCIYIIHMIHRYFYILYILHKYIYFTQTCLAWNVIFINYLY